KDNSKYYRSRGGVLLEKDVFDMFVELSIGTVFEDSFVMVSGQRFPDIVAMGYFGVEVKTTKSDNWISTGSSIIESTRVDGVEKIYLLFGKLSRNVEFRSRPYEDCLSDIVVTHSPRYKIDMELEKED